MLDGLQGGLRSVRENYLLNPRMHLWQQWTTYAVERRKIVRLHDNFSDCFADYTIEKGQFR